MHEEAAATPAEAERSPWYVFAKNFTAVLVHTVVPVKFYHLDRLQGDAPFIVISNHLSLMDPMLLGYAIPRYEVRFLGKKEIMDNPILGHMVRGMHMIVVDRHNSDIAALRACQKTLKEGRVLGIFPEGTRHHEGMMTQLESGAALIALRSGVPLVPVLIDRRLRPFRRAHMYVGEPIQYEDLRAEGVSNETSQRLLQRITETYQQLQKQLEEERKRWHRA